MLGLGKKENKMQSLIKHMCEGLVDNPKNVVVEEVSGGKSTIYTIECDKEDIGKVMGRKGRNINAIRQLARAASMKNNRYVEVEIVGA